MKLKKEEAGYVLQVKPYEVVKAFKEVLLAKGKLEEIVAVDVLFDIGEGGKYESRDWGFRAHADEGLPSDPGNKYEQLALYGQKSCAHEGKA